MSELRFKQLTSANWREPDPMNAQPGHRTADQWTAEFLRPQLHEWVPLPVRRLFEGARGALVYGVFFRPLYVLGSEQLFRVVEAAVSEKCIAMKANRDIHKGKYGQKLLYLRDAGVIPETAWVRWEATKKLRDLASHPEEQMLFGPGDAARTLWITAEQINALFADLAQSESNSLH